MPLSRVPSMSPNTRSRSTEPPRKASREVRRQQLIDATIATLKAAGVQFKMEPFETPVCHMAMVFDPSGNIIIIHKRKPGHH